MSDQVPPLWQLTALAVVELAEAQMTLGNAMLARADVNDPRRARAALALERAASHVRGQQFDPPNQALRELYKLAPKLLDLASYAVDALEHPNAPVPGNLRIELLAIINKFKGERFNGSGSS